MPEIILLCGKTGSSKAAYAKQLKEKINAVLLSCDDMMLALYEDRMAMKHHPVLQKSKIYLVHMAEQIVSSGTNVILDLDLWSAHERKTIIQYFEGKGIKTQLHYIKCPEDKLDAENSNIRDMQHSSYFVDSIVRNLFTDHNFEEPGEDEVDVILIHDPYQKHKTK